ncbi:helix-turn-helix transcriptional regulator [Tissierella praeacuta]|uniref:helix-turn-helix transcriptional regulator n=1 Tax=Tissierella praeacuta TaxID=43131 RepID=UPI003DA30EE3
MRTLMIERRKQLSLTQEEVSKIIGVSRSTYTSYETGAINPSLDVAIRIKKALRTNDDNIFLINKVTERDENYTA